jgi:hypothetical protein
LADDLVVVDGKAAGPGGHHTIVTARSVFRHEP